jgi:hypothetical protein
MEIAAAALLLAASLVPATAYAGCGDPDQPPCTGPVPTTHQVMAILGELTDPNIPAANKSNIVAPGFSPDEAGTIDDQPRLHHTGAPFPPHPHDPSTMRPAALQTD